MGPQEKLEVVRTQRRTLSAAEEEDQFYRYSIKLSRNLEILIFSFYLS